MNCKHVQELLPLYVGRDLEEKRAKLITSHVQSCTECARSAEEYREARQLLQLFEPPPVSEAVYTGIRQRVLCEIGRESPAQTLSQSIATLFRPRIRWVCATALLLAVSLVAFYFIANRSHDRQQLADGSRAADRNKPDDRPSALSQGEESALSPSSSSKQTDGLPPANTDRNTVTDAGSLDPPYQSQRRKSRRWAAADRARAVAVNTPTPRSMITEASLKSNNLAQPGAVPARDPAASEKTLRVEIQTKDPNIRIIWISQQQAKQESLK